MVEPHLDPAELLAKAEQLKEEGDLLLRSQDYKESIKRYAKISLYINSLISKSDGMAQYTRHLLTETQTFQVENLKSISNSSMSAAYFHLKNYSKAIEKANIALSVIENAKNLYRRALAYIEIGDLHSAEEDLRKANALSPNDSSIRSAQAKLQEKKN